MNDLKFQELNLSNWPQFEKLMGEKGGCGGCWCMFFRLSSKEFEEHKYVGNKQLMKGLVDSDKPIGIMAFVEDEPVAWLAVAPREDYPRIEFSKSLARIDDKPVWYITCFFIKKEYRRKGLSSALIQQAIQMAKEKGIIALEAYPTTPYAEKAADTFLYTGILKPFLANGFEVVKQSGKNKVIVRLEI